MTALALPLLLALGADPADWTAAESAHFKNVKQLTTDYVRAGEC